MEFIFAGWDVWVFFGITATVVFSGVRVFCVYDVCFGVFGNLFFGFVVVEVIVEICFLYCFLLSLVCFGGFFSIARIFFGFFMIAWFLFGRVSSFGEGGGGVEVVGIRW